MISYVIGDATQPIASAGPRVVCHVCNNMGAWGAGFVLAVSRNWPEPERAFRAAGSVSLGEVQLVRVGTDLFVANMIAQDCFPSRAKPQALDYEAIATCLRRLTLIARDNWSFHMPRIGCGIAGGSWPAVEGIINDTIARRWPVTVYDLP